MKNNSRIKYLLIGLVALIWGLIVYRIMHALNSDEPLPTTISHRPVIKLDNDSAYSLITAIYPDPFFKNLQLEDVSPLEIEDVKPGTSNNDPAEISLSHEDNFPLIKYNGYIFNPITKRKTAIISIDGYTKSVNVNENINDKIKITFISNQKIGIVYKGRKMEYVIGG